MKKLFLLLFISAAAYGQVSVLPWRTPRATFTDPNGIPLANGCVFTYAGGTTTPLATYTDYTGSTPNTNPVILDPTGSAVMWLGPATYKFVAFSAGGTNCSTGVQEWSVDQVPGSIWVGGTISGATIIDATITNSTYDNGSIGATTPGPVNATYFNGPIGTDGGTPAPGVFSEIAGLIDAMSYSAAPVFNAGLYTTFTMTLTGNVASSSVSGGLTGQFIQFNICQNTAGGWTFAWPSNFVNAPAMPSVASSCVSPQFFYDGTYWQYVNELGPTTVATYLTVAYSATPVFPVNPASIFQFTLSGNVSSSTITGSVLGQQITMFLCQNGTGGYSFIWPTSFLNPPTVPEAPSACITPTFFYDGTHWQQQSISHVSSPQTVSFAATPVFAAATYNQFSITLTGNVTSSSITGGYFSQPIWLNICQDGTGGRTFAWPSTVFNPPTVNPTASACTQAYLLNNGSNWNTVASYVSGASSSTVVNCLTTACAGGSTYAAGTTYTNNAGYPVTEMVSATLTGTSGTGGQYTLPFTDGGISFGGNMIANECNSSPSVTNTFRVAPGATFSVSPTVVSTCSPAGTWAISAWAETR